MSHDTIIERIRKLLRLGTSPNQHEAELAMSRAAEIAAKHKLDLGRIQSEAQRPRADLLMVELATRRPTLTDRLIGAICVDFFSVELIWTVAGSKLWAAFVGVPQDLQIARHVFLFSQGDHRPELRPVSGGTAESGRGGALPRVLRRGSAIAHRDGPSAGSSGMGRSQA